MYNSFAAWGNAPSVLREFLPKEDTRISGNEGNLKYVMNSLEDTLGSDYDSLQPYLETTAKSLLKINMESIFKHPAQQIKAYGELRGFVKNLHNNFSSYDQLDVEPFDLEKEGFVRFLRKIQQDNVNDTKVSVAVDKLITDYGSLLGKCNNNTDTLLKIVNSFCFDKYQNLDTNGNFSVEGSYESFKQDISSTINRFEMGSQQYISKYSREDPVSAIQHLAGDMDKLNELAIKMDKPKMLYAIRTIQSENGIDDDTVRELVGDDNFQQMLQVSNNFENTKSMKNLDFDTYKDISESFDDLLNTKSPENRLISANCFLFKKQLDLNFYVGKSHDINPKSFLSVDKSKLLHYVDPNDDDSLTQEEYSARQTELLSSIPTVSRQDMNHAFDDGLGKKPLGISLVDSVSGLHQDIALGLFKNMITNFQGLDVNSVIERLSQPNFNAEPTKYPSLKDARQELAKHVKCSIQTEPPEIQEQLKTWATEEMLDYKPGEKTLDGQKLDPDGTLPPKFHSQFFKINNTTFEPRYNEAVADVKSKSTDPECYTPMDLVHGCALKSIAPILGISGGWFTKGEYVSTGLALGPGAYFGEKIRKSLGYLGKKSGDKSGILLICKGIRGENYHKLDRPSQHRNYSNATSFSVVGNWHNWEICIKDNKYILPHHFVEVSKVEQK